MHEQQMEHCGRENGRTLLEGENKQTDRQASLREDGTQSPRLFAPGSPGDTRTVRQSGEINGINWS